MLHSRLRHAALLSLAAISLMTSACLTTIDDACATIAETHCASCFECASSVDGVGGGELCDVPSTEGSSQTDCEDYLSQLCERESRTLQDPYDDLDECEQALGEETCDELVEREALDQPSAPEGCGQFI